MVENISNTFFESNTNYCPSGEYGYDVDDSEDEVTKPQYHRLPQQYVNTLHVSVGIRTERVALHRGSLRPRYTR